MRSRTLILTLLIASWGLLTGCDGGATEPALGDPVTVSGTAFAFSLPGNPYGLIDGATVSVVEMPSVTTTTNADGEFTLTGLRASQTATFVLEKDGFPLARTKTFTLPDADLERVTFQVPSNSLFILLAKGLEIEIDDAACQLVTTVTRVGKSLFDEGAHGEAGATVSLSPAIPAEHGPVYFNADVLPDRTLTETSEDGGVVYTNVPPGTYTLTATKAGVDFEPVQLKCEAGVLVNASPPYGAQAL